MRAPGVGLDIVEIERVERLARANPRFLRRIFSAQEIQYCQSKKKRWQHVAARFAAKEAVWKALGQAGIALQDISVHRPAQGPPGVLLRGRPASHIKLSLSHCDRYAMAVAIVWRAGSSRKK